MDCDGRKDQPSLHDGMGNSTAVCLRVCVPPCLVCRCAALLLVAGYLTPQAALCHSAALLGRISCMHGRPSELWWPTDMTACRHMVLRLVQAGWPRGDCHTHKCPCKLNTYMLYSQ